MLADRAKDDARQLLITADEDFCKSSGSGIEKGYGYMRIYAWPDGGSPTQIGSYRTPNSLGTDDEAALDPAADGSLASARSPAERGRAAWPPSHRS